MTAHLLMSKNGAYGLSKSAFTQWLAHMQHDMVDRNVRTHIFHRGAVLTDNVGPFPMSEESMSWDDVQLSGQFAVWLASKEASVLRGRLVRANWDVQDLVREKGEFDSDADLLTVRLTRF